ncbi:MAG: HlyD family efflux transporter periplasmic adaptor subunit [Nitrospira sp.]|nr:HlyD family efflux transporter periplasmic adaptor subunit [Nitrospira sp.]MDH4369953.1 HlyD family efflux transporter periplasmic adaptor subunit [Nitrospira sp.]MDH5497635.1 HlyD family efflux transporter periplasmic adaptor subunit [Nitrospira sp.]
MVSAEVLPKSTLPKHTSAATLLQLERMVRAARTQQELQFLFVNETRRLLPYRQAVLVAPPTSSSPHYDVRAASSVPVVDRTAPLMQWTERLIHHLRTTSTGHEIRRISEPECADELKSDWDEFVVGHGLWCPLKHPDDQILGGLWLTRDQPWLDYEVTILERLSEAYAYAWRAVGPSKNYRWRWGLSRTTTWLLAATVLGALAIPVPMSTLAPAKIVAKDPLIVSAPIDGVIAEIVVPPNSAVSKGDVLFRYEDTTFRSDYQVAERNLDVAMAQYRRAAQGSFVEADHKADVPLLKAEVELRETERNYAYERLAKVEVKADQAGLVLYTEKSDWIGKPVVVGQRIMELADPRRLEVRIDLPVDDAIVLREGAPVSLFLNANPFSSVPATISHASYHAEVLPNNTLAYRVMAQLSEEASESRIGWQGSAKLYGERVTLFTYLFRRPISALRPWIGR